MDIKWEKNILRKCYITLKLYSSKPYNFNFLVNFIRCFFSINFKSFILSKSRYSEYDWKFDVLNSCLYCMTKSISGLVGLIQTSDSLRYNYWLTEPDKLENIVKFISMNTNKKDEIKFLDLGSGPGLIFEMMPKNFKCFGYELNKRLANLGRAMGLNIRIKNILELHRNDIKDYDVIYMFEPLIDKQDREYFARSLSKIVSDNQIVIYKQGGGMIESLKQYFKVKTILNMRGIYQLKLK